jgi:uncharacterized membrane protein
VLRVAGQLRAAAPQTSFEIIGEFFSVISLIALWAIALSSWPTLPETIPIHFGLTGKPDGWGTKGLVFFVPGAATLLYALVTSAPLFPEKPAIAAMPPDLKARYQMLTRRLLFAIKAETLFAFLYLGCAVVRVAKGEMESLGVWFAPAMLGTIFGTIAIHFIALKPGRGNHPPK